MKTPPGSKTKATVWVVENGKVRPRSDQLTTEEPLEMRLVSPCRTLAVTMRSPGADFELAAGFLYNEGVISCRADIRRLSYCVDTEVDGEQRYNIVNVELRAGLALDLQPLERHFFTTSACGVCGKASLEALRLRGCPVIPHGPPVSAEVIYSLPDKLRAAQRVFSTTGGYTQRLCSTQKENFCFYEKMWGVTMRWISWSDQLFSVINFPGIITLLW